jgi:serine/threonine-protein kinase
VRQRASHQVTAPLAELARQTQAQATVGPYSIIAPLARGGTASVMLAEHTYTRERVALKLLHPAYAGHTDIVDRMFAERDVSSSVAHPALLDVLIADRTAAGLPYLVMELLDGENLGTLIDRGHPAIDAIVAIATQIAGALAALHRADYIHCDIKPDNVIVLYNDGFQGWPRVKVIDYGIATSTSYIPTDDVSIAGTPAYMSPEQWRGRPSTKSDVYALGCMLYELLVGEQPFEGTLPQLMTAHTEHLAARASAHRSDIPPALDDLLALMMAKDPAARPSAADVERTLQWILLSLTADPETAVA